MKHFPVLFSAFILSCFFCVFCTCVFAQSVESFDPTKEYSVHSIPDSVPEVEALDIQKSVSSENIKNVQNDNKNSIQGGKNIRNISIKKQSTKDVLAEEDEHVIEDSTDVDEVVKKTDTNKSQKKNSAKTKSSLKNDEQKNDFVVTEDVAITDECAQTHNPKKKYTVRTAAQFLSTQLSIGPNGLLSQLKCADPFSDHTPMAVRKIFSVSSTWNPQRSLKTQSFSNDYLQCVAFVFMSYEMAGKPITKMGRTNAVDFLLPKYSGKGGQFRKYHAGETTQLPRTGDVALWSTAVLANEFGHVGIVTEVRKNKFKTEQKMNLNLDHKPKNEFGTILVANSNATKSVYEFQYRRDLQTGSVYLEGLNGSWAKAPDYWLRKRS